MNFPVVKKNIYLNSMYWQLAQRLLCAGLSLIASIILMRYLQPAQYGIWCFAQSFVFMFIALNNMGLPNIAVREYSQSPEDLNTIISSSFFILLAGAAVACLLCIISAYFLAYDHLYLIVLISLANIMMSANAFMFALQADGRGRLLALLLFFSVCIDFVGKLVIVYFSLPLQTLGILLIIKLNILGVLYITFFKGSHPQFSFSFCRDKIKFLLKESLPLILGGIAFAAVTKTDQLMLYYFNGSEAVGIYGAGVQFVEAIYFIPAIVSQAIQPHFFKNTGNKPYYDRITRNLYFFGFWGSVAIALVMGIVGQFIIPKMLGAAFEGSAAVFLIYLAGFVFVALRIFAQIWIINNGLQKHVTLRTWIGLMLNISLNFLLIPKYGVVGACIASVLSFMFMGYLCFALFRETRPNFEMMTQSIGRWPILSKHGKPGTN